MKNLLRYWNKYSDMIKKNRRLKVLMLFLAIALTIFGISAWKGYCLEKEECFQQLIGHTEQMAQQIRAAVENDRSYLEGFAMQLTEEDLKDKKKLGKKLAEQKPFGMISRLEILFPEDVMVAGKEIRDHVEEKLSFQELKLRGASILPRMEDNENPGSLILRHCVPVMKDGETKAILCGVIELKHLPEMFYISEYGDNFYVYVLEAYTGNFLQDTWHKGLTDLKGLGERKTKRGYSWSAFQESVRKKEESSVVFLSRSVGEYFYAYTIPVGVEDWMVTVNVLESVAFRQVSRLMWIFSISTILFLAVFMAYFLWMIRDIRREEKFQEEQLSSIQYMLEVEQELFEAYLSPKHFITAMELVADYITAELVFLWLPEKNLEENRWCWGSQKHTFLEKRVSFRMKYPDIFEELIKAGRLIFHNKEELLERFPTDGALIAEKQVDNLMLIPVYGIKENLMFIMGACNFKRQWEDCRPLEQVALNFSMASNHYEDYYILNKMGRTDSMTGLLNRNSYHRRLERIQEEELESIGCVFVDVNGLHEVNNYLGHSAGDEMLKSVAESLRIHFCGEEIFRIGGDEFFVLCRNWEEKQVQECLDEARKELRKDGYELSAGIDWKKGEFQINDLVEQAESRMRQDKQYFYDNGGRARNLRNLNQKIEEIIKEKEETDQFLSFLEPEFKGVYFVDLNNDTVRHIFIPPYFKEILGRVGESFSAAIREYARIFVREEDVPKFKQVCDYQWLKEQFSSRELPGFSYKKKDGESVQVRIMRLNKDDGQQYKTMWIFEKLS